MDTAGDGFFAVFDRPADAVRCAFEACREVQELGLDIRGGVHFGEVEMVGPEIHGIVVHTGARVMARAGASEVLVTATVKDLVAGARFDLQERETVELKGVPGTWTLFDVIAVDDELRPSPIENASVASERRDRAATARPPRRGRKWLVPVAAVTVALVIVAAFLLLRPAPTYTPAQGTVAAITENGTFAEPVALAAVPTGIAWGAGRLWVTDQRGQVYWLDPATGDHGSRGSAGVPTGVAVGGDAVWVTNGYGVGAGSLGGVSRIDTAGETLEPAFETPVGTEAITWGAERVWVADAATGELRVFDPATREVERIPLPGSDADPALPEDVAVVEGKDATTVWVGDADHPRVFRVDPAAPDGVETITVPSAVTGLAVTEDGVWVTGGDEDRVTLLDAATGAVITSLEVGSEGCDQPEAIAAGAGAIWVGCRVSGTVLRIDPATRSVIGSLATGGAPTGLVADDQERVWIAVGPA